MTPRTWEPEKDRTDRDGTAGDNVPRTGDTGSAAVPDGPATPDDLLDPASPFVGDPFPGERS